MPRTATVIAEGLKLRDAPNGNKIDELAKDDRLEILDTVAHIGSVEWMHVRVAKAHSKDQVGERGFVASHSLDGSVQFIKIDVEIPPKPKAIPQPAPTPMPPMKPRTQDWWEKIPYGAWLGVGVAVIVAFVYLLSRH